MSLDGSGEGTRIKLANVKTAIRCESVERSELEERHLESRTLALIFQAGHVGFELAKLTNEFSFGSLRQGNVGVVVVVVVGHGIIIGEELPDVKLVAPECG